MSKLKPPTYAERHYTEKCAGLERALAHANSTVKTQSITIEVLTAALNLTCEWVNNEDFWSTSCGHEFCFIDEGPKENKFKGCPYCRGKIKAVKRKSK